VLSVLLARALRVEAVLDMPKSGASYGVFISTKVVADQDRDSIRQLCYQTSTARQFPKRVLDDEERIAAKPENLDEVYTIGEKPTKYMGIMAREAPLFDRTSCAYTTQFHRHDLRGAITNRMIAEGLNPKFLPPKPKAPFDFGETWYSSDFRSRNVDDMLKAKLPLQKPKDTTSTSAGGMLEMTPLSHVQHRCPDPNVVKKFASTGRAPKDNLKSESNPVPDFMMRSAYNLNFNPQALSSRPRQRTLKASHSSPTLRTMTR